MRRKIFLLTIILCMSLSLFGCKDINKKEIVIDSGTPLSEVTKLYGNPEAKNEDEQIYIYNIEGEEVEVYYEINDDGETVVKNVSIKK